MDDAQQRSQLMLIITDQLQTPEHRYFAASALINRTWTESRVEEIQKICHDFPPRTDDFHYRAVCLRFGKLETSQAARLLEGVATEVFDQFPESSLGAEIMTFAGDIMMHRGRIYEAMVVYRKIFKMVPMDRPDVMIDAKLNLAMVYGSALNSRSLQQLSVDYYKESREWFAAHPELRLSQVRVEWISYNRAIVLLFLFQNYEEALRDLDRASTYKRLNLDVRVFKAYAFAQMGRKDEALAELATVDLSSKSDLKRRAFLACYVDLTKRIVQQMGSIQSCLGLENTQTDVLLDLTRTISTLSVPAAEENQMWRKFYDFYSKRILPDLQETLDSVSTTAELERALVESRFKDLQLKNLGLYQNLTLALSGIAVLLIAAVGMALSFWKKSREHGSIVGAERSRLQLILENIDEGIIRIEPGLKLNPEDSSHFRRLVGNLDLQGAPLQTLLDRFHLTEAQKELTRACLNASLGEHEIAWELNHMNLPVEVMLDNKQIVCFWQPIIREGLIESVLLVMHDVTSMSELKKSSEQAREEFDQLLQYAREIMSKHPKAAAQFIEEFPRHLQQMRSCLQNQDSVGAMRVAHTLKGTARSLGLRPLHESIHELEGQIRSGISPAAFLVIESLQQQAQKYDKAIAQLIGGNQASQQATLFEIVATLKPELRELLQRAKIPLRGIRVHEAVELDGDELRVLQDVLMHALTNAADHGYILPSRRGRLMPDAFFDIELMEQSGLRVLTIRDQGAGIDYEALQKLASRSGWKPERDQTWTDFLLQDGVSTLQDVSHSSGRGVGLAAIREALLTWNGQVQLLDNDQGPGSRLVLKWPAKLQLVLEKSS